MCNLFYNVVAVIYRESVFVFVVKIRLILLYHIALFQWGT